MDRNIVHALMNEDLITSMIDPNDYNTVDELINDGIVTIPGAKSRVLEIIDSLNIKPADEPQDTITIVDEPIVLNDPIIDETPVTETPIDETPMSEPIIEEVVEATAETTVVEPADELVTADITTEELKEAKDVKKSTKKTTKKAE